MDAESGTNYWTKAIEKEMRNVLSAFEFRDDDKMPIGYECIRCHMVFDVKIGDLTRKARFCANGNETDPVYLFDRRIARHGPFVFPTRSFA